MSLSFSSLQHLAGGAVTLPIRVAAHTAGLVKGTVSVVGDRASRTASTTPPARRWETVDRVAPVEDQPAPVVLGREPGPVNVVEELGLDPAPAPRTKAPPRRAAVTAIDQQAEPRLVRSTPADVAARISRGDDSGS